jgi:parvulin-like peptidyl-prolyl isomerase
MKKLSYGIVAALLIGLCRAQADELKAGPVAPAPAATKPSSKLAELFGDPILAKGKGVEIKQSQLDEAFIYYSANLAARGDSLTEEMRRVKEAQLLDQLVVTQVLLSRATDADKAQAKELTDKTIAEKKKAAVSEEAFNRTLKSVGFTAEQYTTRIMEQALSQTVLDRELKSTIKVSDAEVEDFYKNGNDVLVKMYQGELERIAKNPITTPEHLAAVKKEMDNMRKANLQRLQLPERVHVIHLLISTIDRATEQPFSEEQKRAKRQEIDKLLTRAKAGEDFKTLVLQNSQDRNLKESGGEYTFSRDDLFAPEFKSAAFSLTNNQISDIVTSRFGYHIIKLLERIPASKLEFAKVAPDIKESLAQQEMQRKMPAHFEKIKAEADIQILNDRYKLDPIVKADNPAPK